MEKIIFHCTGKDAVLLNAYGRGIMRAELVVNGHIVDSVFLEPSCREQYIPFLNRKPIHLEALFDTKVDVYLYVDRTNYRDIYYILYETIDEPHFRTDEFYTIHHTFDCIDVLICCIHGIAYTVKTAQELCGYCTEITDAMRL